MFSAVHSDRSGRLVIATDYAAAMSDGSSIGPLGRAVRLPAGTDVVPLPGRTGIGLDRSGRARDLGAGRFGVAAIVPIGYLRIGLPAYEEDPVAPPLKPRGYAAVGADADGELVVAAIALDTEAGGVDGRAALDLGGRITAMQREHPSNRLLRQLARCAKDYRCRAAANAFLGRHDCALPRLCDAGLDSVAVRLASARAETYEAIHRPDGFRFADVRASIANAIGAKVSVALRVLALPGLTDRARELDALLGLAADLPAGSSLVLNDLSADPQRALRSAGNAEAALGMERMLDRLRTDAAHLRIVALPRPLVRL